MLDFHNHVIPGVDDGAESIEQSLEGLAEMRRQGITQIIATPHFSASIANDSGKFDSAISKLDTAWAKLSELATRSFPDMRLQRGVELALDEPLVCRDDRLCLAGLPFMLVEFPRFNIPPNSTAVLKRLRESGIFPIVAHPERYQNLHGDVRVLRQWKHAGAFLQMNAGSVVGAYGKRVQEAAWRCLATGLVDYLCSDYHSRGQCLTTGAGVEFERRNGGSHFTHLTKVNGERLSNGLPPAPVPPLVQRSSLWARIVGKGRQR